MRRPHPASPHDRRVRRRRAGALALPALVILTVLLARSLACGGAKPHYVLGGSQASVLAPPTPPRPGSVPGVKRSPTLKPARALTLAASLPLARAVAQLFLIGLPRGSAASPASFAGHDWGGVVLGSSNFQGDSQIGALAAALAQSARSAGHLAPLVAAPQEGGKSTAFRDLPPASQATIGVTGHPGLARAQALLAGRRLRALGFNMTLAPLADVDTAGGALSDRLFSTDPDAVARFSDAAIAGYASSGMISAVGHFPGAGGASADPDQMTATVGETLSQLRTRDLVPFAKLTPKAAVIVMSNAVYAAFDGVTPAGLLAPAIRLLRHEYGFAGVVMSDDLDATLQTTGTDAGASALAALQAGDDLLYLSGSAAEQESAYAAVLRAAGRSPVLRARVRAALLQVLALKARYHVIR